MKQFFLAQIFLALLLMPSICIDAQIIPSGRQINDTTRATDSIQKKKPIPSSTSVQRFRTQEEEVLTIEFLIFGTVVLIMACLLLLKFSSDCNVAFKYFIIVLLILGMLLLMAIGYDTNQISPAVGLFGTIAGYLLGKTDQNNNQPAPAK